MVVLIHQSMSDGKYWQLIRATFRAVVNSWTLPLQNLNRNTILQDNNGKHMKALEFFFNFTYIISRTKSIGSDSGKDR